MTDFLDQLSVYVWLNVGYVQLHGIHIRVCALLSFAWEGKKGVKKALQINK